jgi:hypothetical protein
MWLAPCEKKQIEDARTCNDPCEPKQMNECIEKRVELLMLNLDAKKPLDPKQK